MNFDSLKQEIETLIKPLISNHGLKLQAINSLNEFGGPGIEILVIDAINPAKPLDFEILSTLNEKLSTVLDAKLKLSDQYYLIVGSGGLEQEITSANELVKALEKYLALDLQQPIKDLTHFEGYLKAYDPESKLFVMEYFKKGQKQKVRFTWSQVAKVRHAIKF